MMQLRFMMKQEEVLEPRQVLSQQIPSPREDRAREAEDMAMEMEAETNQDIRSGMRHTSRAKQ
eukprot:15367183-Ditylum_brightwellii.AAC.1